MNRAKIRKMSELLHILRWFSSGGMGPFFLGYTESAARMEKDLAALGLRPENRDWLLHNPRGVSTLIFLILRKLLPRAAADKVIQLLLDVCELLGRFPTRKLTACFVAVSARKPV